MPPTSLQKRESMALPLHVMVAWQHPSMKCVVVWQCPPMSLHLQIRGCVAVPPTSLHLQIHGCGVTVPPTSLQKRVVAWRRPPTSLHLQTCGCVAVPPTSHQEHVVVWRCPPTSPLTHGCVAVPPMALLSCVCAAIEPQYCLFALYCVFGSCIIPKLLKTKCGIG
jgi:hypothetical protein